MPPRNVNASLLFDPRSNKGTAFTDAERDRLGLRGLLPPRVMSLEEQEQRIVRNFYSKPNPLEQYIYLIGLQDRNETLFYRFVVDHLEETLPVGRAMRLVLQAAGSLREAHERGLVHRDVKPANLVVSRRGGIPDFVKVLDFGLAKDRTDVDKTKLTGQNAMVGTPLYMAPEAMTRPDDAGSAVDAALGVIESTLSSGDSITFTGFGKFHVTHRAERMGVNPRTGEKVQIRAANVPKFSAGSQLKKAVN